MPDLVRQEVINAAHTIVVKVGTNVLAGSDGRLNQERIQALSDQLHRIRASGRKVVLVSSGAIGAGIGRMNLGARPTDLRQLQACAAIGQNFLMRGYQECLDRHGTHAAQILLTAGDFDNRTRYLNMRNTILTLFEWQVLPIINENDTVSVDELRFGDNDALAALVTNLIQAPLLILLSVVDGLYGSDPRTNPRAELVRTVSEVDDRVLSMAGDSHSQLGTGGMRTKIRSARLVTQAGESVILANGSTPGVLDAIMAAEPVGTLFLPLRNSISAWKRWLGYTARTRGKLVVDHGAREAVENRGRSLLPIGVVQVIGNFSKGDVVALTDAQGEEFARGLTNYAAADATRIMGLRTDQIGAILDVVPYEELVHRDNLVVSG